MVANRGFPLTATLQSQDRGKWVNFGGRFVQVLQHLNKISRLLLLLFSKRLACITCQQHLQKSSQMKLELLKVGVRGHERANNGHHTGLGGNQVIELSL